MGYKLFLNFCKHGRAFLFINFFILQYMQAPHRIVLHIDDDEEDRELLKEAIHKYDSNIIVRQVDNGKAGISFLKQAKEFDDKPCLVVMDLNMPGMDGREVLKEIKKDQQLFSIPLVIFTTSSSEMDKLFAKKEGIEFVTKPHTYQELSKLVERLISHC